MAMDLRALLEPKKNIKSQKVEPKTKDGGKSHCDDFKSQIRAGLVGRHYQPRLLILRDGTRQMHLKLVVQDHISCSTQSLCSLADRHIPGSYLSISHSATIRHLY